MKRIFCVLILIAVFCSCGKRNYNEDFAQGADEELNRQKEREQMMEESFRQANHVINYKEQENIKSFINRRKWNAEYRNGIWIEVLSQGKGEKEITEDNTVTILYTCMLLNGGKCSSDSVEEKTFNVKGDTQVPFGLITAVKMLKKHSKARIIIPSALNFFISKDGEKISDNNTLIYTVEIKEVK
ncbi:MAG: FKBP-type peptidyl-prolyl cis-trans isomerase [Bacteroidales bacterium]|nr:FKBP-type peptidyl-prolyl cis-trans isomerase [Bacteroidales bacterium]